MEGREWGIGGTRCVDVIGSCFSEKERVVSRSEDGEENTVSLRRKEGYGKLTRQAD